ncbi:MAG: arylamine N-acetyltransferase, partial [Vicinamibacteraceae bacterium]|nr:arylamine N-acetyltransferase [Vicinamibacteraceae bacterium]
MSSLEPAVDTPLAPALVRRVCERLGWSPATPRTLDGLAALYRAWGLHIPFDNTRKLVALLTSDPRPLPGLDATDFLEHWLDHGTGGTCWPSANAMFALLSALGFRARRVAGSMRDLGVVSHASTKARLDAGDWLLDSSILSGTPLPLDGSTFIGEDPVWPVEIEPVDGTHLVWWHTPNHVEHIPLRLLVDPASYDTYRERYERSRETSPFNQRLYARRNRSDELVLFIGHTRYTRTARGIVVKDLSAQELLRALTDDIGLSDEYVARWANAGGLDASMAPPPTP